MNIVKTLCVVCWEFGWNIANVERAWLSIDEELRIADK